MKVTFAMSPSSSFTSSRPFWKAFSKPFAIAVAKTSENEAAVDDFQRKSSTRSQHADRLGHYRFVLDLCFKESEGVHENGCIEACRQQRQSPHVASDPTSLNANVGGKPLGLRQ